MNKWSERLLIPTALITGYSLLIPALMILAVLLGYGLGELIARTIFTPTLTVLIADAVIFLSLAFLLTRPSLKIGCKNLLEQLKRGL